MKKKKVYFVYTYFFVLLLCYSIIAFTFIVFINAMCVESLSDLVESNNFAPSMNGSSRKIDGTNLYFLHAISGGECYFRSCKSTANT